MHMSSDVHKYFEKCFKLNFFQKNKVYVYEQPIKKEYNKSSWPLENNIMFQFSVLCYTLAEGMTLL